METKKKRGAMEMSVGTIVTIVLLMTVLILGLVLVRTIFTGAKYNVDQINDKVRDEIGKLFSEDRKIVVYLPNNLAEIKQGDSWGVAWAVKNLVEGAGSSSTLSYEVVLESEGNCAGLTEEKLNNFIIQGRQGQNIPLPAGQTDYEIIRVSVPETAPLCVPRYRINTQIDGENYASIFFDVEVKA